jgi:hypothetical protein
MNAILTIFLYLTSFFSSGKTSGERILATGKQPEVSVDAKGVIRVVFGRNDSIFYSIIHPETNSSSIPTYIARVSSMHLGMTRGPQLASSAHYSMITAMDKEGNIHWYLLDHKSGKCVKQGRVNDQSSSAPEGLMGLAADKEDHFYATWLDLRLNRQNNLFFSSFSINQTGWSPNQLVYRSPDGHICECCKPNIAVQGTHIAVMFRNWLNGSRDLYLAQSSNSGKTFSQPQKLGSGTWKLKGCPMDGGGVSIDDNNRIATVWQREGAVYYCRPGDEELRIGKGRSCSVSSRASEVVCSYQNGDTLMIKDMVSGKESIVGKGSYLKTLVLSDQSYVCVWEQDGQVKLKHLSAL